MPCGGCYELLHTNTHATTIVMLATRCLCGSVSVDAEHCTDGSGYRCHLFMYMSSGVAQLSVPFDIYAVRRVCCMHEFNTYRQTDNSQSSAVMCSHLLLSHGMSGWLSFPYSHMPYRHTTNRMTSMTLCSYSV